MERRVRNIGNEFQIVTEARLAKSQMKTLDKNCILNGRLYQLGERLMTLLSEHKSRVTANASLKREVEISRTIKERIQTKFQCQLEALKHILKSCSSLEMELIDMHQTDHVKTMSDAQGSDEIVVQLNKFHNARTHLSDEMNARREQWERLKLQYDELKEFVGGEAARLHKTHMAQEQIKKLVHEITQALMDAQELFDPEITLNFTERDQRKSRLLTSFFILLHTSDQLRGPITPHSLGAGGLVRSVSSLQTSQQSASGQRKKGDDELSNAQTQSQHISEGLCSKPTISVTDVSQFDQFQAPILAEFGLVSSEQIPSTELTACLMRELSICSRHSLRSVALSLNKSVAVQTERDTLRSCIRTSNTPKNSSGDWGCPQKPSRNRSMHDARLSHSVTQARPEGSMDMLSELTESAVCLQSVKFADTRTASMSSKLTEGVRGPLPSLTSLASL